MLNKTGLFDKLSFDHNEDFESMFKIFSKLHHPLLMNSDSRWLPEVDLFETDDEVVIILDVANVDPKNMEIFLKKGSIIIKGVRHDITKYKKRHYHKMEIDYGPFERTLDLPVTVDENDLKSRYCDGFLEVRLKTIEDRRQDKRIIKIDSED